MEIINMFEKGDKYIHFTKYGGVNKGEVADIFEMNVINTNKLCKYVKFGILTTNGVRLHLDGSDGKIYKITSEMTKERAKELSKVFERVSAKKHRSSNKEIHSLNENKKT